MPDITRKINELFTDTANAVTGKIKPPTARLAIIAINTKPRINGASERRAKSQSARNNKNIRPSDNDKNAYFNVNLDLSEQIKSKTDRTAKRHE